MNTLQGKQKGSNYRLPVHYCILEAISFSERGISILIIHQIFSLARDWSKRVTWANIPQLKLGNIRGYNSPINFHVILLATLRHVV